MAEVDNKYDAFAVDSVIPLQDRYYYYFIKDAIAQARYKIWASLFIIGIDREQDYQLEVRDILNLLSVKHSLGVDVKIIIGDSDTVYEIRELDEISRKFLQSRGIAVKKYKGTKHSTHSKYMIIDDELIVVGSHNWTMNAFSKNREDSVAIYSRQFNSEMNYQFLRTWMD